MQIRSVKGMNDLLPAELSSWHRLEEAFKRHVALYGFAEVRPPIVEPKELFVRSIGEVTDVVQKEMYIISRGDEELALRPEGTAGCARAYLEHSVHGKEPTTRWFYIGPMFRAERPQRGRYRQFYQAGCEVYGDPGPMVDAELMAMLVGLFSELGIEPLTVKVNSVGTAESRARYREQLVTYLRPLEAELSETSRERLVKNPLRILDSKNPRDQELLASAPSTVDALTDDDRAHFNGFCSLLDAFGVPYVVDPKLVRGLDYYTRTVFEIITEAGQLGAQNTIAAGGRYDRMLEELGGPNLPAFGFAMGLERILLALGPLEARPTPTCAVLTVGHRAGPAAAHLATALRSRGVRVDLDARDNSPKSKLRRINTLGIPVALILGDSEVDRGVVQLKNLTLGTQEECSLADAPAKVQAQLTSLADPGQKPTPKVSEPQV